MARSQVVDFLLAGVRDSSGNILASGKVYTYIAGTTTNKTTWTDKDKTTSAANPVILDSRGTAQIWADGLYKFVVKNSADVTIATYDNLYYGETDGTTLYGGLSSGASNTYNITVSPSISGYSDGQLFVFTSHQSNSASCTLNVNSKGAKTLASSGNAIISGVDYLVRYNASGDRFYVLNSVTQESTIFCGTTSGTNTITATAGYSIGSYATGQMFRVVAGGTNTGATTLNINGLGAKTVYLRNGRALVGNEIVINRNYDFFYNGTGMVLQEPSRDWVAYTPTVTPSAGSLSGESKSCRSKLVEEHSCHVQIQVSGTISTSAPTYMDISLPYTAADTLPAGYWTTSVSIGGVAGNFAHCSQVSTTAIRVTASFIVGTYDVRVERVFALA